MFSSMLDSSKPEALLTEKPKNKQILLAPMQEHKQTKKQLSCRFCVQVSSTRLHTLLFLCWSQRWALLSVGCRGSCGCRFSLWMRHSCWAFLGIPPLASSHTEQLHDFKSTGTVSEHSSPPHTHTYSILTHTVIL